MQNVETGSQVLMQLSDLGIRIYVDDFGTGYSSLSYLARLRVNALKIDRSFIMKLPEDLRSAMIVRTIVTLGHNLGLAVIAEGVETEEQRDFLRQTECGHAQGYWFYRPLQAEVISGLLLQHKPNAAVKGVAPSRLRAFDIFTDLGDQALLEYAQSYEQLLVKAGRVMIRQGQVGRDLFLLEKGSAGVYRSEGDSPSYTAILEGPSVFGERALMDPERIRTANVRAVTDLHVLTVRISAFLVFLRHYPLTGSRIRQLIERRMRNVREAS